MYTVKTDKGLMWLYWNNKPLFASKIIKEGKNKNEDCKRVWKETQAKNRCCAKEQQAQSQKAIEKTIHNKTRKSFKRKSNREHTKIETYNLKDGEK